MKFLLFLSALAVSWTSGHLAKIDQKLTEPEIQAVIQAVQDEIYDYGYEVNFFQMGENLGTPSNWKSKLPIYVNPVIQDGEGEVIYKLMPYGEIYRIFALRKDGLVVLDAEPDIGFPPTQPSHKTVYMEDDEVCRMKHGWFKRMFEVDVSPGPEMIQEAVRRQKMRTGFSDWEYVHSKENKKVN